MIFNYLKRQTKIKLRKKLVLLSIAVVLFSIISLLLSFKFQMMQFEEIGWQFTQVLWTNSIVSAILMAVSFLFIFICIVITNLVIKGRLKRFFAEENMSPVKLPNFSLAVIVAVIGGYVTEKFLYPYILPFLKAQMFNTAINADPLFGKNFGYYLFQRPFFLSLCDYLSGIFLIIIIYTIAYYVISFGAIFNAIDIKSLRKNGVVIHNLINIAAFFLVKILEYRFVVESVLFSSSGKFFGADYVKVNVWLKAYTAAPFILSLVVILAVIYLLRGKYKKAGVTILMYPAYWLLALLVAVIVQLLWVLPNELTREKNYISNNIELTRMAYNLSGKMVEKEFDLSDSLSAQVLDNNKQIIDNISLLDGSAALDAQNQFQSIRSYYRFNDTDAALYDINKKPEIAYITARELDDKNLDEKTYDNLRYKYTHGYGVVMSPVSAVNESGNIDFLIKDIPGQSSPGAPQVLKPQIYFGELTKEHVVVNLKNEKEIDYQEEEATKETVYNGKAGINLTPLNRIMASIMLKDPGLLFSGKITSASKVLLNRDIVTRTKLIAPFLDIDEEDAYMVINKVGNPVWVIDAYTESINFPYSQPTVLEPRKKINYIRNSVKITVDAYDGTVKLYIMDAQDPIIMTYQKIYPEMFEKGAVPADIAKHFKYPQRLLKIQSEILRRYHTTDEAKFFGGKDVWDIPLYTGKDKQEDFEPYVTIMKQAGSEKYDLVNLVPFTSKGGTSMTGMLAVRPDMYSKATMYLLPRTRLIYGPKQMDLSIDKDQEIAKTFNTWRQQGSSVIQGTPVFIPLEYGKEKILLYVKPVFLSEDGNIAVPQLKKVIVGYQGRVVMEDTLKKALQKLLVMAPYQDAAIPELKGNKDLIESLIRVYDEYKTYSASNDWENAGKKMKEIDEIISAINERKDDIF